MKSRLFSMVPRTRPSRPRFHAVVEQSELKVMSDKDGSVAFGWAAHAVLYTRFYGGFTAPMGYAFARPLSVLVAQVQSLCFFCDASELKHYDLLARSAFARVILSNRLRITSLVMLASSESRSPNIRALVATLGEPIELMTNTEAFEIRLLRKAPLASPKLNPRNWVAVAQRSALTR